MTFNGANLATFRSVTTNNETNLLGISRVLGLDSIGNYCFYGSYNVDNIDFVSSMT